MRPRPLMWFIICLLCLAGAYYFWELGEARRLAQQPAPAGKAPPAAHPAQVKLHTVKSGSSSPLVQSLVQSGQAGATNVTAVATNRFAYRLTNTSKSLDELLTDSHAILLENALIDTRSPLPVFPDELRAQGDPGTYIVQAGGPLNDAFRALLARSGATIVSYIPNNAYLVRASAAVAGQLRGSPQTQAVVPYEPYYKLQSPLLAMAVRNEVLPEGTQLNVLLFADQAAATATELKKAGYTVLAESGSPFGPVVTVQPPVTRWVPLAQMPGVQLLEVRRARMSANDLTRVTLGTAADTVTLTNYLGLTGSNVLVNINDTSVDATHPDLAGRVFGDVNADYEGHGTFVAGVIAGNGTESSTINSPPNLPSGSVTGANFRGEAPGAELFSLDFEHYSDQYLQETAAQTNALISNNSWFYVNDNSYDLSAASYDAAVRDALPEKSGSQPIIYVFAAGNEGNGNDSGQNGNPDSITSPGTAKNVITVGAIEQDRNITNEVVGYKGDTNPIPIWQGMTDSSNEVASFSSRGNVGIGIEGDFGRFKPDVVAPGTFLVSTRSAQWDQVLYYNPTNIYYNTFLNQEVDPLSLLGYSFFTPINAVELHLDVYPNQYSLEPFPDQYIYVSKDGFPDTTNYDFFEVNHVAMPPDGGSPLFVKGGNIFYSIYNTTNLPSVFDLQTTLWTTNDLGDYQTVLSNLNETLGPWYRYESGTSMSAGGISGMLALMEEFFMAEGHTNSPALMKALVINGARSVNSVYDMQVENAINYQGWGLANLPNSLPPTNLFITEGVNETQSENKPAPMILVDQSPVGALATGQSWTRTIKVDPTAQVQPLRVTLVWTDPPGNPAASPKLVNNLDLVVTNLDTDDIYYGNDINSGFNFNQPHPPGDTNTPPKFDTINNVENVFLQAPVSTNYSITVIGRNVNVNAVTANTNEVAQDYALVISSGDGRNTNALTLVGSALDDLSGVTRNVTKLAGTAFNNAHDAVSYLQNQRVGASSPLIGDNTIALGTNPNWGSGGVITLGVTNQWHFYVVTNLGVNQNFTNAAFVTFLPPNLSVPRMGVNDESNPSDATRAEADIDLYVSTDSELTNLVPSVVAAADKSLSRGGTEFVVYSNSAPGKVYYVGVKSEDQEAAQYQFLTDFSDVPFASDDNGVPVLRGFPVPQDIPDGSPQNPGVATVVAISPMPVTVRRVVVTNILEHQNFGDLIGTLRHGGQFAVLNNHTFGDGNYYQRLVYEDNGENDIPGSQHTDGPGSLRNFVGEQGAGVWTLTEMDTALTHTGRVDSVSIRLDPENLTEGTTNTIAPLSWQYYAIDVPPTATNLTITITNITPNPLPLDLYAARGYFPTQTKYDKHATILPPGGSLTITKSDLPPLQPGRYYIGVYNPNVVSQTYIIYAAMEFDATIHTTDFTSANLMPIPDDAVTNATLNLSTMPKNVNVFSVNVGVSIQHPRVSDLVLTLISPQGSRNLLMENRGGTSTAGAGGSVTTTNVAVMSSGFESAPTGTFPAPANFNDGTTTWTVQSNQVSVILDPVNAADGSSHLLALANGSVSTVLPTTVGQTYTLTFRYRGPGIISWWRADNNPTDSVGGNNGTLSGGVTYGPGFVGGGEAFEFNGASGASGGAVKLGDPDNLKLTNSFSVEGWIKPRGYNGLSLVFWRGDTRYCLDPYDLMAYYNALNGPGVHVEDTSPGCGVNAGAFSPLPLNQWEHITGTFDGTSGALTLYTNGVLASQLSTTVRPFRELDTNFGPMDAIGNYGTGNNDAGFNGWIDELSIYDRSLSASEVRAIYQNGAAGKSDPAEFAVSPASSLAKAEVSVGGGTPDVFYGANTNWQIRTITFTATQDSMPLQISGLEPGMLIDSVKLTEQQIQGQYLLFTEDTDLTDVPIKFATTPFKVGGVVMQNGFETPVVTIGRTYYATSYFCGGWYLESGSIDLLHNNWQPGFVSDTGAQAIDLNGDNPATISTNISLVVGQSYRLSFAYTRNPGSLTVPPIGIPSADINLNGTLLLSLAPSYTNTWDNVNWQTTSLVFTATSPVEKLQAVATSSGASGVLLDSFKVENINDATYFPEESLGTLQDQPASGPWQLEILDDRAGPLGVGPTNLLSWQLQFFFTTNFPPAVALQNGVPSTNVVAANGFTYFTVDVPSWATAATNLLLNASGNVTVWFNQDGIPSGSVPPDTSLIGPATAGTRTLDINGTGGPPVLQPGRRYYLGVQNTSGTAVTFTIEVDYDLTTLSNGVPVTATNRPSIAFPRYFRYDVSSNASAVQFTLSQLSGNADLVVRHGLPVPTLTSYDYGAFNSGTNDESIILFTNSVTLTPGTWYLGVFDEEPVPVSYTIEALELTNEFPNIITLTNGVAYDNTNAGGTSSNDYYLYVVSTNAARAQFEINNATASMALVAHKNLPLPDLTTYDYISTNPYPNDQLIVLYPDSTPVALTSGDWFLTAVNLSGGTASYSIKATEWAVTGTNLNVRGYLEGNNFCLEWDSLVGAHYVVQGKANLSDPSWTDVSQTITATDVTTTYCVPLPSPYSYFRVIEGESTVSPPPPNISGIAYSSTGVTLQWTASASQQFQVQWTTNLASPTWNTFTNIIGSTTGQFTFTDDGKQSGGLGGVKFYRLINYP